MTEPTMDDAADALRRRIGELEVERDALRHELDEVHNSAITQWVTLEHRELSVIDAMRKTVSWRVTKPLRAVRTIQLSRMARQTRRSTS